MNNRIAYHAKKIFTGEKWLTGHAIVVENDVVKAICPLNDLPADIIRKDFAEHILAPAFIDLQIYGAAKKLFSAYPFADSLQKLNDYCRAGGAAWFQPTVATNSTAVFKKAIDAVRDYRAQGGQGVIGLHLEGPWINASKKGAHLEEYIEVPTLEKVRELLDYGRDVITMITLAPELCDAAIVKLVLDRDIIVSAGHSNAGYEDAVKGFDNGITAVTHLYNAMSPLQHRAPGLAGAAMDDLRVMASIIPDGHHVDYAAIRIAKTVMKERLFVITDAVTTTDTGPYQHQFSGDKYESAGILSGSALTMQKALGNLVTYCNVSVEEALKMCSLYPAKVIKKETLGKIQVGEKLYAVVMDEGYDVEEVICGRTI